MKTSSLTDQQKANRLKGIGGTDAKKIMDGEWVELWEEKTSRKPQSDLSDIFKVQLGIFTESFNLQWLEKATGWLIELPDEGRTYLMDGYEFIRCHPDAFAVDQEKDEMYLIDAKHTGAKAAWWNEEKLIGYYYWQMQHNMMVTNTDCSYLSVIWGNDFGEPIKIPANPEDQAKLLEAEKNFWWHVENDEPPMDLTPEKAPAIALDDMREVSAQGDNVFANYADEWLANKEAAKLFKTADTELKNRLDDDVKRLHGYGIEVMRKGNGRTIKELKNDTK